MFDMKFKMKYRILLNALTLFICGLWILGDATGHEMKIPPEEEIASLKQQLRAALDFQIKLSAGNTPTIYAITPTYARPVQKAELTRLSQSFRLVPNFHWIVVEDSVNTTNLVTKLLQHSLLNYTLLNARTPPKWRFEKNKEKPRGVLQRNKALTWLRENKNSTDLGVIYFADDDNTYHVQVFEEMRYTKGVSVWPVGLAGDIMVEKCVVNTTNGRLAGSNSFYKNRVYQMDMAAFGINLNLFLSKPNATFAFKAGLLEESILRHLVKLEDMEPRANNCSQVYVWHTRTEKPKLIGELEFKKAGKEKSDKDIEV